MPGQLGSGTYLHKLQDPKKQKANGNRACPSPLILGVGRPTGDQCDEYPFRSTQEGASTAPVQGSARTFPFCDGMPGPGGSGPIGFSRCYLNATQNGGAGAKLGAFYRADRILDWDLFQVGSTT